MAYIVKSPLVVAKTDAGYVHVYEGGVLPDDVDSEQLKQLVESEMVEADGEKPKRGGKSADDGDK